MDWKRNARWILLLAGLTGGVALLPLGNERFTGAVLQALALARWYAREHVLFCLAPAFFIAGGISVFISASAVTRYLGPRAHQVVAYAVASVSGSILAVCSCTVLPLFAGIYRMGAGIGPATAFLYAGPAINVLAIILTARILGLDLGVARAVGAVVFSVVIGLTMQLLYGRGGQAPPAAAMVPEDESEPTLVENMWFFGLMVAVLVFANWARPASEGGAWAALHAAKWYLTAVAAGLLGLVLRRRLGLSWVALGLVAVAAVLGRLVLPGRPELPFGMGLAALVAVLARQGGAAAEWLEATVGFAKQILPLLLAGVLVSGFLLGGPDGAGVIPDEWVARAVGGNGLRPTLLASVAGALMYFATLTEVPILQGLLAAGMGKGPALALLLAGPALSLPNMLVIRSVLGTGKTVVFVVLVIVMATVSGLFFAAVAG